MIKEELIRKVFYNFVDSAKTGFINVMNEFIPLRFDYFENDRYDEQELSEEEYLGNDNPSIIDEDLINGSAHFIPSLIVNDVDLFFKDLTKCVNKYYYTYKLNYNIEIIKYILLVIFSNARYYDYKNPIEYLEKYITYFDDETFSEYNNKIISNSISVLDDSYISVDNKLDLFGLETPYVFNSSIVKYDFKYNLPSINYAISDNVCYIYSIQNKVKNEENNYTKKIKRKLNKINAGVVNDTEYEKKDTVLGTTPSFLLALTIFFKLLSKNNIDTLRVVTLLPTRYLNKDTGGEEADAIQRNLTEKLILNFYRLKYHFNDIEINFPIYDGYSILTCDVGSDLIVKIPEIVNCDNNEFLNEIVSSFNNNNKVL